MSGFLIRDGLESDLEACLALDHSYETEYVWQMNILPEAQGWQLRFKTERLPRPMEVRYPADPRRLTLALPPEHCFLVAVEKESSDLLGYAVLRHEPSRRMGWLQDLVVDRSVRRERVGSRLLKVARQWASEHEVHRLIVETQTKNYPSIQFCTASGLVFCGYNDHHFDNQDIAVFFGQTLR